MRRHGHYIQEVASVAVGIAIIVFTNVYLTESYPLFVPFLSVVGGLIAVGPPLLLFYGRYRRKQEIESQFLVFIADLNESINSGMTLPLALEYLSQRNYLALTSLVNDLAAQVDWGIPFQTALRTFSKKSENITLQRSVSTIIQAYDIGGKIADTLSAISESLISIEKIKKERSASVHSQIVTGYLIFFIFIAILVILNTFLLPALSAPVEVAGVGAPFGEETPAQTGLSEIFQQSFVNFIIVQGLFAGLATGKMAEGSIIAGMKHSILLIALGYTIFSLAIQFQINLI
ncbi:MAG: type II secretion system F family protein [Nanoarchaeota archaeon]|nr:type II secretion system F family protein [Nanoarchaeota archaeon]